MEMATLTHRPVTYTKKEKTIRKTGPKNAFSTKGEKTGVSVIMVTNSPSQLVITVRILKKTPRNRIRKIVSA